MPQTDSSAWLQFAIQQMAAESYLDGFAFSNTNELIRRLKFGSNNAVALGLGDPDATPILSGKTRFTTILAQQFTQRYQIIDHHADDATGFSATLLKDPATNTYTLSFRSLEYQNQAAGGDWERDGFNPLLLPGGAAGEIALYGFALGQLVSMERYFADLEQGKLTNGVIDPTLQTFFANQGNKINVTGYSLGGHLATVFTLLHANRIDHTYTFNGAGIGQVGGVTPVLTEDIRLKQLIDAMDAKFIEFDQSGNLVRSGSASNVQTLSWYQDASFEVAHGFGTTGTASMPTGGLTGGVTRTDGAFSKITQLFGHATNGVDIEVVANSGIHGPTTPILIEGQPLLENVRERDYGNSHSITLIVDSLALQDLFLKVDPTLTQDTGRKRCQEPLFASAA